MATANLSVSVYPPLPFVCQCELVSASCISLVSCLCFCLCFCLCLSVRPSVFLVCISVSLPTCLSVSVCLPIALCLPLFLSPQPVSLAPSLPPSLSALTLTMSVCVITLSICVSVCSYVPPLSAYLSLVFIAVDPTDRPTDHHSESGCVTFRIGRRRYSIPALLLPRPGPRRCTSPSL